MVQNLKTSKKNMMKFFLFFFLSVFGNLPFFVNSLHHENVLIPWIESKTLTKVKSQIWSKPYLSTGEVDGLWPGSLSFQKMSPSHILQGLKKAQPRIHSIFHEVQSGASIHILISHPHPVRVRSIFSKISCPPTRVWSSTFRALGSNKLV